MVKLYKCMFPLERITQNVVKSHIETSQYSSEELKRLAWTLYTHEEIRVYQNKVCQLPMRCITSLIPWGVTESFKMCTL